MSLALMGNRLVSLGSNGTDGRVLDVLSGGSRSFALSGLVRKGARLTPSVDGSALLLTGGHDASGVHDDVWKLDLAGDGVVSQRLVADSASPDPRHASRALLGYAAGGLPVSVGSATDGIGLSRRIVGTTGWRAEECLPPSLIGEAVVASSDLWVGAGAELTSEGGPASGASLAGARVGVGARLGTITSGGALSIGVGAQVAGNAIAAGDIDSRGTISGLTQARTPTGLEGLGCFDVQFPQGNRPAVRVAPGRTTSLAPGAYSKLSVLPRGKVALSSGTYYFDEIESLPLSRIQLDTSSGAVRIYVRSKLKLFGDLEHPADAAGQLLIGYLGNEKVTLVRPLAGTLVAPRATVQLANWESHAFNGAFLAYRVEVLPFITVNYVPFNGEYLP